MPPNLLYYHWDFKDRSMNYLLSTELDKMINSDLITENKMNANQYINP